MQYEEEYISFALARSGVMSKEVNSFSEGSRRRNLRSREKGTRKVKDFSEGPQKVSSDPLSLNYHSIGSKDPYQVLLCLSLFRAVCLVEL